MSLRFLFAMLVAVAMTLAPLSMPLGEASAAATGHHAMKMAGDGHCADQPAKGHSGNDKSKPCCTAGCMATATLPALLGEAVTLPRSTERPALDQFIGGIPAEIATPPPRLS